ncbi:hypothetical protein NPIL_596711 [Nephila pilipes]|uniref:Uncharacterized protein n=1 Tax=Nephila pilipes TaxID=299642 RepID=A0A8X6MC13_NEPPI|nr:hypothetical protein NPIL_596711 [Nephila pilipes]
MLLKRNDMSNISEGTIDRIENFSAQMRETYLLKKPMIRGKISQSIHYPKSFIMELSEWQDITNIRSNVVDVKKLRRDVNLLCFEFNERILISTGSKER